MKTWQDRGSPYMGYEYSATTPHYFWDGKPHYWTGMAILSKDEESESPNCCQSEQLMACAELRPSRPTLDHLRHSLRRRGYTHQAASAKISMGISGFRERVYGRRPIRSADFNLLCRLAGVDPKNLSLTGEDRDGGD